MYLTAALIHVELLDIGNMTTCLVARPAVSRWTGPHERLDIASPHSGNIAPHVRKSSCGSTLGVDAVFRGPAARLPQNSNVITVFLVSGRLISSRLLS